MLTRRQHEAAKVARRLGARIRSLRTATGMKQEELAGRCEIDKGYLSQIEAGKRQPTVVTLLKLLREMGVAPTKLFEGW